MVAIGRVVSGPLPSIAQRFSDYLASSCAHDALIIFTKECTGRPRKVSGDPDIVNAVTISELDAIKAYVAVAQMYQGEALLGRRMVSVAAILDVTDTLLVLVNPRIRARSVDASYLNAPFGLVATSIRQQVAQASPDYLAESRAATTERARTIAELTEVHEAALSAILDTLRSSRLTDERARLIASDTASSALIAVRAAGAVDQELSEEAVATAFASLVVELRSLLRHKSVEVEYVQPPADGRALPGEIAHAARAMGKAIVLAFAAQESLTRLRVQWGCDGKHVLVEVRDNGGGGVDRDGLIRQLSSRLAMLRGIMDVEVVAGWGSRVALSLPLDAPIARADDQMIANLNRRELDVLARLARGMRNKPIATELAISESTVKFHVANILKKLEVGNRGEAGLLGVRAGLVIDG
ncbi:LuxR C-terminal-related transcriptional regulator [Rhodococcus sp. NBC_00297]|uniref:LuxR C-terminal-related transcriptional regulator n=1 Tax=Rhodococcus sp. NBC_00297 TaxID=2976005 RepID=UPI002E2B636E|nr:LuxR C-terminal-related transcriptional regulator [Rhodococcus sp. NBC_00297]